jgi:8-oxo-dGTP pyrophosphatase MutT (NUDIX family)
VRQVRYHAAGGVVIDGGRALLLSRPSRGEVRLPKGHIENGESAEEAALREVREESGYVDVDVIADLGKQQVQFADPYRERDVTRHERYYLMQLRSNRTEARPEKELQFDPYWVPLQDAASHLTYEAEQEYIQRAIDWLARHGDPSGRVNIRGRQ